MVNALINLFSPKFTIKCTIHNHQKGYRIYRPLAGEESMKLVKNEIIEYMHKDMLYKIIPKNKSEYPDSNSDL